jgi:retinol dehydrogenase 14
VVLAEAGAKVVIVGRDPARTAAALTEIQRRSGSSEIVSMLCDFSSQESIRKLAADYRAQQPRLDILVNNAGMVSPARVLTVDGIESTFATNHLGYFLLTNLLLDLVVASAPARIVNVSSVGHRRGTMDLSDLGFERGYAIMKAYGRSKLGNVLFTRELARRLQGKGVIVNSLHPGAVATNIWSKSPGWIRPVLQLAAKLFMISPAEGGATITHLAMSPEVEGKTGLYFEKNRPVNPSPLALDDALAAKLWDESAKLTKLG